MFKWLLEYVHYEDNKETNLRLFKSKFAHTFNDADDNLFKEIIGQYICKISRYTNKYNKPRRKSDVY